MYIGININITFFFYEINFTREIGLQKTKKIYLPKKMNIFLPKKMNIFSYLYGMLAKNMYNLKKNYILRFVV